MTNSETSKVDYAGRTVDLLLLKTVLSVPVFNKRVQIDVSNVSGEPMIVTGIEKMVQRYALLFINAMGSTKFMPNHGTEIVPLVTKGMVYDMATLESAAAEANVTARMQMMLADETEETPDDERIVDSQVLEYAFSRENAKVKISVRLTSAAGSSYVYIIPVAVGVH